MKKADNRIDSPLNARVVHRSIVVDQPGTAAVVKVMLNVRSEGRQFVTGSDVAFELPNGGGLRHYTVEAIGEVPFEDTLDLTIFVRQPREGESATVARMLGEVMHGDELRMYGPLSYPFYPPMGSRSNMIMIGAGCGMVPFRWLARKVHERRLDWMGKVLMLEGPKTGLEHLYVNDATRDQDQFFDAGTYRAFEALKTRYSASALDREESAVAHMDALWRLMGQGSVYVYLAGYRENARALDEAMCAHLRVADRWYDAKAALIRDGHWLESLYD